MKRLNHTGLLLAFSALCLIASAQSCSSLPSWLGGTGGTPGNVGGPQTPAGEAVFIASLQMQGVQAAMQTMKALPPNIITPDVMTRAKSACGQWVQGENTLADILASWKETGNLSDPQAYQRMVSNLLDAAIQIQGLLASFKTNPKLARFAEPAPTPTPAPLNYYDGLTGSQVKTLLTPDPATCT